MDYKICTKCGEKFEATTEFFGRQKRGKFGLRSTCKLCNKKYMKRWHAKNAEQQKEYNNKYHTEHREQRKEHKKRWRKDNANYDKEYYTKHKEERNQYGKEWAKNNRDKRNANGARYRAKKLNQTPANANMSKIELYFIIAEYLNKITNTIWHVDHIQPLAKGGLHHQNNLQLLPCKLNLEKNAKWPLTPEEEIKYNGIKLQKEN